MSFLTRTEELILLSVWNLQENAYGAAIRDHLSDVSGYDWSIGAIYIPLDRLAHKGYVKSYKGKPTPHRGGRSKRYFELTPDGKAALIKIRGVQDALWKGKPLASLASSK
jgi:PadR family transcriptional regulator PadR